jgi:hypothetical protein
MANFETKAPKFAMLVAPTSGKGVAPSSQFIELEPVGHCGGHQGAKILTSLPLSFHPWARGFAKWAPPDSFETHCSNPLSYVSRDPHHLVGELQSVGYMLYPKKRRDGAFWE